MEAPKLEYGHLMFLLGMCNATSQNMMRSIMQHEDAEMSYLDVQFKTILDGILFLAIAREDVNQRNFGEVIAHYGEIDFDRFTLSGKDESCIAKQRVRSHVVTVAGPLVDYLDRIQDESVSKEYRVFLETLFRAYT